MMIRGRCVTADARLNVAPPSDTRKVGTNENGPAPVRKPARYPTALRLDQPTSPCSTLRGSVTFTVIRRGFASSFFGSVIRSTPWA